MNGAKAFFDTNVLLYLASAEREKAAIAEQLLSCGGVVSVQVLNEFIAVARRKMPLSWIAIAEFTASFRSTCDIVALTLSVHDRAVHIAERYRVPIYDAMIVAAAIEGGCSMLLTEDFQNGQLFESCLRVFNPFAASA